MICYLCASYISKILPIILLALAKKIRNYSSTFYFKFGKNTSLSHLQVNGKLVYPVYTKKLYESLIHCLTSIKTQPINNQHADATPGNQACYVHSLSLVERVLSHFLFYPGAMNLTIGIQKMISLLKFACNTDLGPKKFLFCKNSQKWKLCGQCLFVFLEK